MAPVSTMLLHFLDNGGQMPPFPPQRSGHVRYCIAHVTLSCDAAPPASLRARSKADRSCFRLCRAVLMPVPDSALFTERPPGKVLTHICWPSYMNAVVSNTDSEIGTPPTVRAVFGTMTVPNLLDAAATRESLQYFLNAGFDEVDTSSLYEKSGTEATLGAFVLSCGSWPYSLLDVDTQQC